MSLLTEITRRALVSLPIEPADLIRLFRTTPEEELFRASHLITARRASRRFDVCTIVNAKSGRCTEDCRWCAQSRHWETRVKVTPILPMTETARALQKAEALRIRKFSFVTSGRKLSMRETREIEAHIREAAARLGMEVCGSFGLMDEKALRLLKASGLTRLHCNLETGRDYFPKVCTTHTREEKIATLKAARRADLDICSGGLFGMGETFDDRVELAFALHALDVRSIPLNFLSPIAGTPMENARAMPASDVLKTIALFRFVNPAAYLRFAGGLAGLSRQTLQSGLYVGVNSAIVGGFLTTAGLSVEKMLELAREAGYRTEPDQFNT